LCLARETQAPPLPDYLVMNAIPGSVYFTASLSSTSYLVSSDFFLTIFRLGICSVGTVHLN